MELRFYLSLIGLIFTLELFSCSPASKCRRSMNVYNNSQSIPNMALLGGTEDTKRKYNYMVRVGSFEQPDCAGVLLAELWVLTTGHCVDILQDKNDFKVYGGGTYGVDEQTRDIATTFSTNDDPGNSIYNKIGLLKLNKKFDKGVGYAKIATSGWPENKKEKCTYVGYGRNREGKDFVTSRKVSYLDMVFGRDEMTCGCRDKSDISDLICLKVPADKGPCRCNGGTMVCDGVVKGVLLFYFASTGKCGSGSGNGGDGQCGDVDTRVYFSNVGNFHSWIETNSNGEITERITTKGGGGGSTTKGGGGGGGGGKGKSKSSINKSNSYMQTLFILYLVIRGLKSDLIKYKRQWN